MDINKLIPEPAGNRDMIGDQGTSNSSKKILHMNVASTLSSKAYGCSGLVLSRADIINKHGPKQLDQLAHNLEKRPVHKGISAEKKRVLGIPIQIVFMSAGFLLILVCRWEYPWWTPFVLPLGSVWDNILFSVIKMESFIIPFRYLRDTPILSFVILTTARAFRASD